MKKELTKFGMFLEGIIIGIMLVYLILNFKLELPLYPYLIGLLCLIVIATQHQEEVKHVDI